MTSDSREAVRLEQLWASEFGDAYLERNAGGGGGRDRFWRRMVECTSARRVLEVGSGHGANLRCLSALLASPAICGVDINWASVARVSTEAPGVNASAAVARALPFADASFDLVFTVAVLMHQPDDTLPVVMSEIVRCSRRFVLCAEYFADERTEVDWRDQRGALIKRDYRSLYETHFPTLELVEHGFLDREDGFDRTTYALFRREAA